MHTQAKLLTQYFSEVQRRSNLVDHDFGDKTPYRQIPLEHIREGHLDEKWTAELYELDQEKQLRRGPKRGRKNRSSKPLDIVISLATLKGERGTSGLLLLPASLTSDGQLAATMPESEPWIPASRLRADGTVNREVMVGDLSSLGKWRTGRGRELASKVESWSDVLDYTRQMFAAIVDHEMMAEEIEAADAELVQDECFVSVGEMISANGTILELYADLEQRNPEAPVYEDLVSSTVPARKRSDALDSDPEELRDSALRSVGSMSDKFPLTDSQRRAAHAFLRDEEGSVTAVSGPPGTGKTTLLQSVVASLIVQRALDDAPAPLIVGTSTNNQAVTNIVDSFNSVTKKSPGLLDQRWLLGATEEGASDEPLRGLASYCPAQSKVADAKDHGYLVESTRKDGVYTLHSNPEYVDAAKEHFLAKAGHYAEAARAHKPTDLKSVAHVLRTALTVCDETRRELISARAAADAAIGPLSAADIAQQQERIEIDLAGVLKLKNDWLGRMAEAGGPDSTNPAKDSALVRLGRGCDEPVFDSCVAYVAHYRERQAALEQALGGIKGEAQAAEERERNVSQEFRNNACGLLGVIRWVGLLNDSQIERLASASSLAALDKALDVTVRYVQFWLAVHFYEAQWLLAASGDDLIKPEERGRTAARYMERYWPQATSLTPFFVMTAYQLPKYFKLWSKDGERSKFDLGRIDLLIVDEAGQVDTSVGAAAFALARRALVVGDVQQLAPVWGIDPESDRVLGTMFHLSDWDAVEERGLTASDHSSIMKAASFASRWSFGPDDTPGLFLSEHFRCHAGIIGFCNELLYKGMLVPSRPEDNYALDGLTPGPFLFQTVDGSRDKRSGSSRVNEREADAVAAWINQNFEYFREIYNPDHHSDKDREIIGVVTPFAAQARLIEQRLAVKAPTVAKNITVGTAHRLQGAERAIVLFSPVYGENSPKATFIDGTLELMNVAVSRAKDLFVILGSDARLSGPDPGPVFSLVNQTHQRHDGFFGVAEQAEPLVAKAPTQSEDQQVAWTPTSTKVDRHDPDHVIARDMIERWNDINAVSVKVTARKLNVALQEAGLIFRSEDGPIPTEDGAALGIRHYEAEGKEGRYVNLTYSPMAQARLAQLINDGDLNVESEKPRAK